MPGVLVAGGGLWLLWQESQSAEAMQRIFPYALWTVVLTCGVIALGTGLSLHFFLARPVRRMRRVMARAEQGDLVVRAESQGSDELALLGKSFNSMLARLTSMKAEEIDTHRDLAAAHQELQLKDQLEHRLQALSLLYDVARSLTATLELPEVMQRITRLLIDRVEVPQFSIMLVHPSPTTSEPQSPAPEPEPRILRVASAHPPNVGTEGLSFHVGEGACGRAAAQLRAVYLPDITTAPELFLRRHFAGEQEHGSLLAVPMVHKGSLLGVLNFQRPEAAAFSADELELLDALADIAAMAVKNALLYEETVRLSITDALTGMLNRRALFNRLDNELSRATRYTQPLSLLMIDIDHFKHLNDTQGHRAGDETLIAVADTLKRLVRKVDTLGRYGGEEFLLVLPQVGKEEALEVAEKLRRAIEEMRTVHASGQPGGRVTISVGVSSLPEDSMAQDRLIDAADAALYASKRGGRNKATAFTPGMEHHPGRERGPYASQRRKTGEIPAA